LGIAISVCLPWKTGKLGRFLPVLGAVGLAFVSPASADGPLLPSPILFVTQVPIPGDFTAVASTFGNHVPTLESTGRGGDLYIRYGDGTLKNLTAAAGYGNAGFQGATSIAVREPSVYWDGTKALFSMVVGSTPDQYVWQTYYWQIYEITGFGQGQTPVITKVPNQPANANNVSPFYGTDDRILFTSDRPHNGAQHLYPQLDEYEEAPTTTGLWSLNPITGDLRLLNHSPSGVFSPTIDSYGRVIFTRWDHLQRDQQADTDYGDGNGFASSGNGPRTFNFASEAMGAAALSTRAEVFPEPRSERTDLLTGTNLAGNSLNHFFPWQINQDGTAEETLNHIGRHELHGYFNLALTDDPALHEFNFDPMNPNRFNPHAIENMLEIKEDPTNPGTFFGVDAPEFYTHAAGGIVKLTGGDPSNPADQMAITYVNDPVTSTFTNTPPPNHSGHYRNPLPLSNGTLVCVHDPYTGADYNTGDRSNPGSAYAFRLKTLALSGAYYVPDQLLTPGITKAISYYDPDYLVTYSGTLWELDPVEVRARTRPTASTYALEAPEISIFNTVGISPASFQSYLAANNLAVIVSRNVTTRDKADRQQPFNLHVAGSSTQTTDGGVGKVYDIAHLQLFQGDLIRGLGGVDTPREGRRVLAQVMHDPVPNPPNPTGPAGSVKIGMDGSQAAFVPAHRAMTWQITDPAGVPVIRERYWLTFQPGEVRVCASCHGVNTVDQAMPPMPNGKPTNAPEALKDLLCYYKGSIAHIGPTITAPAGITLTQTTCSTGSVPSLVASH